MSFVSFKEWFLKEYELIEKEYENAYGFSIYIYSDSILFDVLNLDAVIGVTVTSRVEFDNVYISMVLGESKYQQRFPFNKETFSDDINRNINNIYIEFIHRQYFSSIPFYKSTISEKEETIMGLRILKNFFKKVSIKWAY